MSKETNPVFEVAQRTILALTEVEEEMREIMRNKMGSEDASARAGATLVQAIMAKHSVHMTMFEMASMGRMAEDRAGRSLYIPTVG